MVSSEVELGFGVAGFDEDMTYFTRSVVVSGFVGLLSGFLSGFLPRTVCILGTSRKNYEKSTWSMPDQFETTTIAEIIDSTPGHNNGTERLDWKKLRKLPRIFSSGEKPM